MSKHVFGTWYPASDPPEAKKGRRVLVVAPRGDGWDYCVLEYDDYYVGWMTTEECDRWTLSDGEFWMPLPPPPTAEATS